MNRLTGSILSVKTHRGISLIKVKTIDNNEFAAVVVENLETSHFWQPNSPVEILFKETEVSIAVGEAPKVSIQNKFRCEVVALTVGEILCQIDLQLGGSVIRSIITQDGCAQLGLKKGDFVYALVKSNEVILSAND